MLRLTKDQLGAFERASIKRFEEAMVAHVKSFFPNHYRVHGEATICATIQYGIERARGYNLETRRDVCLYINLMLALGSNFDIDTQLPWAQKILTSKALEDPSTRIARLSKDALSYVDFIAGVDNTKINRMLLRVRRDAQGVLFRPQRDGTSQDDDILARLAEIFPDKYMIVGEPALRRLIRVTSETAQRHGVMSARSLTALTVFAFILGSAFDKDPQLTWAATVLTDPSIPNEHERINRLFNEAMAFLDKWLVHQ